MRELSIQDLTLVQGAFALPGAVAGGAAGLSAYSGSISTNGKKFDAVDAALATGAGAFAGFFTGPVGIGTAVNTIGASAVGGITVGGISRLRSNSTDKSGSNYGH
ncbi:hypothetical protein GJV52_05890 [Neisseria brasiliensis]|uniref:hypothetical protein n=1 Tax=Neisseria TaxID=482 RepID=UPI000C27AEC4|nr:MULTISPECIES: hypothetical protein [Neisseria]PJO79027.1 hypothetical protein CWC45_01755 [Neisseria sp. N177_16]QGL25106.1 hypothetical protein GJV52_05890 [Neisseria brasiliensis]